MRKSWLTVVISSFFLSVAIGCHSAPSPDGQTGSSLFHLSSSPTLEVRHITVGMSHDAIIAAGSAARMKVLNDSPTSIRLADPTASGSAMGGASSTGGSGLVIQINFSNGQSSTVTISEQGDTRGHIFEDLSKKWGKPAVLPNGYDSEEGTSDPATWGDRNTVYAEYHPSIYAFGGQNVTIYDAKALATKPEERKAVPM